MTKTLNISPIARKRVAILLLLNFFVSTILVVFPQNECDGMCSLDSNSHECTDMVEMTCCDMMGMNDNDNSSACGTEVAENSCDFELNTIDNLTFVIPKTLDSEIIFVELSSITIDINLNNSIYFILSQNIINDVGPPIYLAVSSFLI